MRFRIITLLLFFALGKAFSQGNSIYQIAPQPVCWTTDEGRDSNLIAYWIFSPTQPRPKVVSYLVADGSQIVVSGGTLQNGFCCCNSNQDTIGITINGDTLILVQNGNTYTYIGGGGDDDWRWVDPGAQENMYEAIYRMGKASIFTEDTTHAFRVDSTFHFRTDGGKAVFDWSRGDSLFSLVTWLFRAPGGGTGQTQNDKNSITIARTNPTSTRTTVGKIMFAAPFGVGDSLRLAAQIDVLDEEGGGATSNTSINFWTRQLGESFIRNTMTLEGNGRLELDRYFLFSDGVPANFLGYDVTDKDVKRHPISGTPQANFVPGINATNTGLEWKDPSTFGPTAVNIYNSDGSIPAAVNRVVTVPTDGNVSFVRGNYTLGYQTTGLGSAGTGQGWASKFSTSATNFAEVWAGTQISVRSGFRTRSSSTQNLFEATNALAYFESRNTGTNNGSSFQATTTEALMSYFASGSSVRGFSVNSSNIFAYETSSGNFVTYPSLRPGVNSFWRYNTDGTGQYVNAASIGATDLTFSGSSSPVTLNSSTGTDVTLTAGSGVTFSQAGNNLTISSTGGGGSTDLGVSGTSSPLTVTSSTGTDITLTAGTNVTLTGSGGNNATIASADANLAFSGSSSPVSLTSSTGTDVSIVAGTNVTLSQAGNALTINSISDGNGIYGGSGTVANGTSAALAGTFTMATPGGDGLHLNLPGGHVLGSLAGNRLSVNPSLNLFAIGNPAGGTNAVFRVLNQDGDYFQILPQSGLSSWTWRPPTDAGNANEVLINLGGGVSTWGPVPGSTTDLTFSGGASPVTLNSSTGTDVTLTAGSGVSFSQAGNNLTISSTGGGGSTDLGISGTSSPLTVTSSTGTDITLTAGTNVTLTGSGGNNATIASADANLAFSGSSSPVSLTSSTGTDVSIVAGTNVTLSQAGNALTINAGNTDLGVTGTSSPLTVTSSTGSDITLTAGTNVTLTGSGGNNVTISSAGGTTDLTFSGSASPVTLNSSSGTDVTLTAGTGIEFSQAGNNLTVNASDAIAAIKGKGTGTTDASSFISVSISGLTSTSVCVCSGQVTTGPVVIYCTPEYLGENDVLKISVRDPTTGSPVGAGTFASFNYICYK